MSKITRDEALEASNLIRNSKLLDYGATIDHEQIHWIQIMIKFINQTPQLSDDINELLFNVKAYFGIERKDKHPIFLANINRMNLIEQHIQAQASEIKERAETEQSLTEWVNELTTKLNAIREVFKSRATTATALEAIKQILGDE